MVRVVQLVERQIVVLVVVGASPTAHPAATLGGVRGLLFYVMQDTVQVKNLTGRVGKRHFSCA